MPDQLRTYTINPGEMAAWLEEWSRLIVPLRRRQGFEIVGAWTTESNQFIWILRYDGPKTWDEADAAYYASPERTTMQPDPARHIAKSEHWLMSAVDGAAPARASTTVGQFPSPARGGAIDVRVAGFPAWAGQGGGGDGSITATEVITYAGALVTLAGLGTLLGTQYRQLGVVGRLAIPGLVTIAALLVARALPGERARARRAQTSLVTLAVAAIGLFTGQLQAELLGGPDASIPPHTGWRILLLAALVSAVLAAVFLWRLRAGLLAAALSVSLLITAIVSILLLDLQHGWPVEAVFLVTGAILVAAAEYGRRQRVLWATEVLAFSGPSMAIITAFISARDDNLPLEIFGGLLAGAAFAASVYRGSAGYAFAGGIGLFAFVLDIEFRYFQSSLGFAVSLVISGLVLLGIALLLARLVPRLRRDTPSPPSPRGGG
jgi:hypothetical protein